MDREKLIEARRWVVTARCNNSMWEMGNAVIALADALESEPAPKIEPLAPRKYVIDDEPEVPQADAVKLAIEALEACIGSNTQFSPGTRTTGEFYCLGCHSTPHKLGCYIALAEQALAALRSMPAPVRTLSEEERGEIARKHAYSETLYKMTEGEYIKTFQALSPNVHVGRCRRAIDAACAKMEGKG